MSLDKNTRLNVSTTLYPEVKITRHSCNITTIIIICIAKYYLALKKHLSLLKQIAAVIKIPSAMILHDEVRVYT